MLKNRSFLVKLVKDQPANEDEQPYQLTFADLAQLMSEGLKDAAVAAVIVTGGYVTADTVRQIAIHVTKTKIK